MLSRLPLMVKSPAKANASKTLTLSLVIVYTPGRFTSPKTDILN